MKKLLVLMMASLALFTTACSTKDNNTVEESQTPPPVSEIPLDPNPENPEIPDVEDLETLTPEMPVIADAALYRGIIRSIEDTDEGVLLELEQVTGTDFGYPTLTVLSTTNADLALGDYVEIYYGAPMGDLDVEQVTAIQLTKLPDADLCVYVGQVEELDPENNNFLLKEDNGNTTLFLYDEESQLYLNMDELKVGDQVSVYTNGATTRSLPPQAFALEVRLVG